MIRGAAVAVWLAIWSLEEKTAYINESLSSFFFSNQARLRAGSHRTRDKHFSILCGGGNLARSLTDDDIQGIKTNTTTRLWQSGWDSRCNLHRDFPTCLTLASRL